MWELWEDNKMTTEQGSFCWYELVTTEPEAAAAFYADVVGWSAADAGRETVRYTILSVAGAPVAGVMALPSDGCPEEARPGWIGNIAVEDVDAAVAKVERAGGKSYCPPSDIPGVGRFVTVADPQGATFILFNPVPERQRQRAAPMSLGHSGWHELHADDGEAAFASYSDHFGWTKAEALEMGQIGTYQLIKADGPPFGAMMASPDGRPPGWLFYFVVHAIEPAIGRIHSGGGTILNGPMEVLGGAFIVQAQDPQGAMFALVAHSN